MPVPPVLGLLCNIFNCTFFPVQVQMVIFNLEEEETGNKHVAIATSKCVLSGIFHRVQHSWQVSIALLHYWWRYACNFVNFVSHHCTCTTSEKLEYLWNKKRYHKKKNVILLYYPLIEIKSKCKSYFPFIFGCSFKLHTSTKLYRLNCHWKFAVVYAQNVQNMQSTMNFTSNHTNYMSVQSIWNLSWLLEPFACCKIASLSFNFVTAKSKHHPKTTGHLLWLCHWHTFLSALLLKGQMVISV